MCCISCYRRWCKPVDTYKLPDGRQVLIETMGKEDLLSVAGTCRLSEAWGKQMGRISMHTVIYLPRSLRNRAQALGIVDTDGKRIRPGFAEPIMKLAIQHATRSSTSLYTYYDSTTKL